MKYYGNINLNQNELQNAVLPLDTYFPANPKMGQLVFSSSKILYICVDIQNGLPVWCPLTNIVDTFTYTQAIPAITWTIPHNLNSNNVQVQIFDGANRMVIPNEVTIVDKDTVQVEFGVNFAGRAVIQTGNLEGSRAPDYGFEYVQTSPATTWTINHNLGYYPIARVFIGNEEVQPLQIIHDSVNTTRILFTTPYVGLVKFM